MMRPQAGRRSQAPPTPRSNRTSATGAANVTGKAPEAMGLVRFWGCRLSAARSLISFMRYTPPATMQYRPNIRQTRGKSARLKRFLEKNRAAKTNTFLIHSRGRVETSKRERMGTSTWVRDDASSSMDGAAKTRLGGSVLGEKGNILPTSAVRRYSPDH